MGKISLFIKQYVAMAKGDDVEAEAAKSQRQAESALKTQISSLKGDTISFEDAITDAKETLESAKVHGGKVIPSNMRDSYVDKLLTAKNNVTIAETAHKQHLETIKFLEEMLDELTKES